MFNTIVIDNGNAFVSFLMECDFFDVIAKNCVKLLYDRNPSEPLRCLRNGDNLSYNIEDVASDAKLAVYEYLSENEIYTKHKEDYIFNIFCIVTSKEDRLIRAFDVVFNHFVDLGKAIYKAMDKAIYSQNRRQAEKYKHICIELFNDLTENYDKVRIDDVKKIATYTDLEKVEANALYIEVVNAIYTDNKLTAKGKNNIHKFLDLRVQGYTQKEIAGILDKTEQTIVIYNKDLQRIAKTVLK